jgi:Toxin PAAR-like domain
MSVTACNMDTVHAKSGHQVVGVAPSVCNTPAPPAPAPVPVPYPVMGNSMEGAKDPPSRVKISGSPPITVGSCFKACHGNEPGTLKEVVSLNTGGPCFLLTGAPTVIMQLGMAGITGSQAMMNKGKGG